MHLDRRAFLAVTSSAVASATLAGGPGFAAEPLSATAVRQKNGAVRLQWTDSKRPARVLASSDADAPAGLMRVLAKRARTGSFDAQLAATPRPYFLVQAAGGEARAAERLLPLAGGRNFRDLGGYRGADGRQVRWGRIYRSGVMGGLTAEDLTYLDGLGIETVCDLRSKQERTREPGALGGKGGVEVISFDYEMDYSDMGAILRAPSREAAIAAFADGYVRLSETLASHYRDVFQRLARREAPLAFNCSAGKDRTGVLAALILSVLGVSRADVVADYALSETYVPPDTYLAGLRGEGATASTMGATERAAFANVPEPVLRVLLGSPAEVMEQTLARLDKEHGGPVAFVKSRTGLGDADVESIRAAFLYG